MKLKYSIFIGFLIFAKILICQNNSSIELNEIYVLGPGEDIDTWCKKEFIYFELNDTTLIKFNESSAFEKRLVFKSPILLEKNQYRIFLKNSNNEILYVLTFLKDSVINGSIILNLDYKRCCINEFQRYVFFDKKSSLIQETYCDNKKSLIDLTTKSNVTFELVGLITDSIDVSLANSRINNVQQFLLELGIEKNKIIKTIKSDYKIKNGSLGSEYRLIYSDIFQKEELGVLIILKEE